jgi:hypothetical protein
MTGQISRLGRTARGGLWHWNTVPPSGRGTAGARSAGARSAGACSAGMVQTG